MPAQKKVSIVVTVADQWMDNFAAIKDHLEAVGMHIDRAMPTVGVISGSTTNLSRIKAVEGVESVNIESSHYLPPSSAKVQ